MTTELNLQIRAGADYQHDFTVYESEDDSEPRDLTGDTIEGEFRLEDANGRVLFVVTPDDGISISDAVNGVFRMTIDREKTESLRFRYPEIYGTFDLELTPPSGFPRKRIVDGEFTITRDNTRGNNS
ncbi:hypothetical protein [Vibrio crassostreae]|uniref:hypothetical protein n=1 Tax=Vibrio crassostreae TaxID=246167 RepID=UPI001053ADE7|nr:hypothetical protein [Vibrio crassostreae]